MANVTLFQLMKSNYRNKINEYTHIQKKKKKKRKKKKKEKKGQ